MWRRRLLRGAGGLAGAVAVLCVVLLWQAWEALGESAQGERLARMEASPQWDDGVFENPQPLWIDTLGQLTVLFTSNEFGSPKEQPPYVEVDAAQFDTLPASGLRVTWLGHSTLLIEIEGRRFLTDPIWSERTSPLTWVGPSRWYPPPLAFDDLPALDAVLISHDHYDHLDFPTIVALKDHDTTFVAPLGVGAHLAYWGVPEDRIVELDWWDEHPFGDLRLVAVPARHASGRVDPQGNRTLWSGYAMIGADQRALFSGDTGLFPAMDDIGEQLGPFDLTMIEVGAYGQEWPDWHLGPEQAVRAHTMMRGKLMLPVHWGLFNLAFHGWTEPVERVLVAAEAAGVQVVTPLPGATFEPARPPAADRWWPDRPWRTVDEYPIEATQVD